MTTDTSPSWTLWTTFKHTTDQTRTEIASKTAEIGDGEDLSYAVRIQKCRQLIALVGDVIARTEQFLALNEPALLLSVQISIKNEITEDKASVEILKARVRMLENLEELEEERQLEEEGWVKV